MNRRFLLK